MQHRDMFLQQYENEVFSDFPRPSALRAYMPVSCLKDGIRGVYLLRGEDDRCYVLKMQPTGQLSSLFLEYEMLQSMNHPQIPKGICCFQEDGVEYLVREYVPGISLAEFVTAKNLVDERVCIPIILSLCRVLMALHAQKPAIIHRDIKPQNVILSEDGACHLVDFGTARYFAQGKAEDTVYLGSRTTAPPEQFGFGQTDIRSDVYSLGMLIRYLLTGCYEPLPAQAASLGLRWIVSRCTAFDPRKRFSTIAALRRDIRLMQQKRIMLVAATIAVLALTAFLCWPVPAATHAGFTSPLLAAAVRMELGLPENAPIPLKRLSEIEELVLCGDVCYGTLHAHEDAVDDRHDTAAMARRYGDIVDLVELAPFVNLRTLVLDYQCIGNAEPLRGLPIERLSLKGNRIKDLSPLAGCHALMTLDVSDNPVEDCSALNGLARLSVIDLNGTNVRSLEPLAGAGIEELCRHNTPVVDFTPLSTLRNLRTLEAGYMSREAFEVVTQLDALRKLTMHDCTPLKDFTAFAPMRGLQELDIAYATFDSLDGLEQLPGLRYLNLTETGIRDVSVLKAFPALARLELRHNKIQDLSPLLSLQHLQLLVLEESQRAQAKVQLSEAPFKLEIRPD